MNANIIAQSSRKTIATTAEDVISDSFQEHLDEELLQNELKNIDEDPVFTKRGVSLAPIENTAVIAISSRKTIAPTAEVQNVDSFQKHIDDEILSKAILSRSLVVVIAENEQFLSSTVEVKSTENNGKFFFLLEKYFNQFNKIFLFNF